METLPKDPFICLSYINTQLRDYYMNLQQLCEDRGIDRDDLERWMEEIGYFYQEDLNQFK